MQSIQAIANTYTAFSFTVIRKLTFELLYFITKNKPARIQYSFKGLAQFIAQFIMW